MTAIDDLEAFADAFLSSTVLARVPHDNPSHMIDGVTAVTLHREPPFQVQMFIVPPNHIIPEHTHPNVDSVEVYMGGDIRFTHSGKFVTTPRHANKPTKNGASALRGLCIRVRPSDVHGGVFGPQGGVFLSVQHWLHGVSPTCVSRDYVGVVMGPQHMAAVTSGRPRLQAVLSAKDAASLEN